MSILLNLPDGPIVATRYEATVPRDFRLAVHHNGVSKVQGGYHWSQGRQGGIVWKDLPVVYLDPEGKVIQGE